jgi:putative addiction module component (TIGR02574 family)
LLRIRYGFLLSHFKPIGCQAVAQISGVRYHAFMTQVVAHLLEEAEQLSVDERTELAERLVERLAHDIPHEIVQAQMREVHRRIAQVEAGEVTLIPGDEALARVRELVASYQSAG